MERENERREEEELITETNTSPDTRSVKTKGPEAEIRLYRNGKGLTAVFQSALGGWDQDRLEVQDILDKYGLKSIHAFSPESGRGVPIRFSARDGRSFMKYEDGAVVTVDGEPKDSLLKPITKILFGVAVLTLLIALVVKETPEWFNTKMFSSNGNFPPWILGCVVIVFTRLRKRTKDFLTKKLGK